MKNTFKLVAMALALVSLTVACQNKKEAAPAQEEPVATETVEATPEEEPEVIAEEVSTPAPKPAKEEAKKEEAKMVEVNSTKNNQTIKVAAGEAQVEVTEEAIKVAPKKRR